MGDIILSSEILDYLDEDTKELKLQNNTIKFIETRAFKNLRSLTFLDISNNKITFFPFLDLPELTFLDMSNNKIRSIDGDFLCKIKKLEKLFLNDNLISVFMGDFSFSENLKILNLSDNFIDENSFSEKIFSGLEKLENLNLDRNYLKQMPSSFSHLKNLKELSLLGNNIEKLREKDFNGLENLITINLDSNEIKNISGFMFKKLKNLKNLILTKNNLTRIKNNSFEEMKGLKCLFLNDNKISVFEEKCFHGLENLVYLDIQDNDFIEINQNIFTPLTTLTNLYVFSNENDTSILRYVRRNFLTKIEEFKDYDSDFGKFLSLKIKSIKEDNEIPKCHICLDTKNLNLYFNKNYNDGNYNNLCFFVSHKKCYNTFLKYKDDLRNNCLNGCLEICDISNYSKL
jgi:Leucine-rich repeat (LRR) protein